jgi:uncharacterized protein YndB with AHSA1/START domain
VEVEQRIEAAPDTVFSYLIDPVKFVTWMGIARIDHGRDHADARRLGHDTALAPHGPAVG